MKTLHKLIIILCVLLALVVFYYATRYEYIMNDKYGQLIRVNRYTGDIHGY